MDMMYIYLIISGLILGSFYNVIGLRLPKNESILFPRSHCVNCNHKLCWYELIPVLSYIILKGKCKECHKPIALSYPLVEIATAILFIISYKLFNISIIMFVSIIVSSIVIITIVSDCNYYVILDEVILIGGIIILILFFIEEGYIGLFKHILGGVLLFLLMLAIKLLGDKSFKQESLGWGDVKLSALAGIILGVRLGVVYIFLGALLALPYAIYSSIKKNTAIIPFGPFLVVSLLFIYWNIDLITNILNKMLGV